MEGVNFLERELSYKLVGCFYDVRNLYGSGLREKFFDEALDEILMKAGLPFVNKPRILLYSKITGKIISYRIPDKLVADKIIVEIKAKPFTSPQDAMQAKEYLSITSYEILYLINFGEPYFKPIRLIKTNDRKPFLNFSNSHPSNLSHNPSNP